MSGTSSRTVATKRTSGPSTTTTPIGVAVIDDDKPRRSRIGWPDPEEPEYALVGHTHEQKRGALIWLYVAVAGLVIVAALIVTYMLARGAQRDAQNEQVWQQIRDSWCLALDTLPEGGLLDLLRDRYDCGPGLRPDQLPPELRQQYGGVPAAPAAPSTVPLAPLPPAPPLGEPASPDAPQPVPNRPSPGNGLPPAPSPAPTVPPPDVPAAVCDLLPSLC